MGDISNDPGLVASRLTDREADALLDVAEAAIRRHLPGCTAPAIDTAHVPASLRQPAGAFVTLHVGTELNGCVGSLDGSEPLADSVADLAVKAAFDDPRLPPLRLTDLTRLRIEISILSARLEIAAGSRSELLRHLRPERHGLVIRSGDRRAVFLPSVWEQLPRPDHFLDQLLRKAGLTPTTWPDDLVAAVFTTASAERHLVG